MKSLTTTFLGLLLLFFGGMMLLGHLHLGWLIPVIIGLLLINKGWKRYHRRGKKLSGVFMIFVGLFLMAGLIGKLMGIAFTIFLIYFGWKMLKESRKSTLNSTMAASPQGSIIIDPIPGGRYDAIDEWERHLKNKESK